MKRLGSMVVQLANHQPYADRRRGARHAVRGICAENVRGKRDWERYRREAESRGEQLDFAAFVPKPVPNGPKLRRDASDQIVVSQRKPAGQRQAVER